MSSNHDDDSPLTRRARQLFDASVASVDARTRSRLAEARARALERRAGGLFGNVPLVGSHPRLAGAGALAAAAAVAMLFWNSAPQTQIEMAALGDLDLLLGEDEFEMLEELEFYAWLEAQAELEAPAADGVG